MIQQVDLSEAQVRLLDLVDAALRGMTVLIAKDNQQAVQLVPVVQHAGRRMFGSAKGLITLADDEYTA